MPIDTPPHYHLLMLSAKFCAILKHSIQADIQRMQAVLDDDNSSDEQLAEIDYGNDQMILKMILDELNQPNHQIQGQLYQLTQNKNATKHHLQYFSELPPDNEQIQFIFSAKNQHEAIAIQQQFLGFAPYQPMPERVISYQHFDFLDTNNQNMIHRFTVKIYEFQHFGEMWQSDIVIQGYGEDNHQTIYAENSLNLFKNITQYIEQYIHLLSVKYPNLQLIS